MDGNFGVVIIHSPLYQVLAINEVLVMKIMFIMKMVILRVMVLIIVCIDF